MPPTDANSMAELQTLIRQTLIRFLLLEQSDLGHAVFAVFYAQIIGSLGYVVFLSKIHSQSFDSTAIDIHFYCMFFFFCRIVLVLKLISSLKTISPDPLSCTYIKLACGCTI